MTKNQIIEQVHYYNTKVAEVLNRPEMQIEVELSTAIRRAGSCRRYRNFPNKALIRISYVLAEVRSRQETENTIVHELCHAYNTHNDVHGPHWQRIAKKVGDVLGFKIKRTFSLTDVQEDTLESHYKVGSPVALLEVPEIDYKRYIYRKSRGYYAEYKGWFLRVNGKKYDIKFTKLQ